jgi:hypothetical protein
MIISLGFVVSFWFRAMVALDKLVKYQYENLPDQWERDGQPHGMFWRPEGKKPSLFNRFIRGNPGFVFFRFIFAPPIWVKESPEPTFYLKQLRKFTLFWNIGVITLFFVIFPAILIVFTPQ